MTWSSPKWWDDAPVRVDLAEIMDDLDPGWSGWREPQPAGAGLD